MEYRHFKHLFSINICECLAQSLVLTRGYKDNTFLCYLLASSFNHSPLSLNIITTLYLPKDRQPANNIFIFIYSSNQREPFFCFKHSFIPLFLKNLERLPNLKASKVHPNGFYSSKLAASWSSFIAILFLKASSCIDQVD